MFSYVAKRKFFYIILRNTILVFFECTSVTSTVCTRSCVTSQKLLTPQQKQLQHQIWYLEGPNILWEVFFIHPLHTYLKIIVSRMHPFQRFERDERFERTNSHRCGTSIWGDIITRVQDRLSLKILRSLEFTLKFNL